MAAEKEARDAQEQLRAELFDQSSMLADTQAKLDSESAQHFMTKLEVDNQRKAAIELQYQVRMLRQSVEGLNYDL